MKTHIMYPPGVPCWVETLQADPRAAIAFYSGLFGWDAHGPGPMPDGGEYYVARLGDRDVAGIATLPRSAGAAVWTTYVCVDDADAVALCAGRAGGVVLAAPFDADPAGRAAILASPDGAVFGIWQPRERKGAQLVNAPRAWAMSTLRTNDLPGSTAFYGALFGWQAHAFNAGTSTVTLARLPGYVGGTQEQPVPRDVVACMVDSEGTPASWNVDFWIDDTDAAAIKAGQLGGSVVVAPYDTPIFRQAVLADREGAIFSIGQLKMGRTEETRSRFDLRG